MSLDETASMILKAIGNFNSHHHYMWSPLEIVTFTWGWSMYSNYEVHWVYIYIHIKYLCNIKKGCQRFNHIENYSISLEWMRCNGVNNLGYMSRILENGQNNS